jgi:gamma-glutamyltranspeptidase/glutathione hydrolase
MKKTALFTYETVLIVSLLSFWLMACEQLDKDRLPSAEDIIEEHLKATGGRKAHEKIRNRKTEYRIDVKASGLEVDLTDYQERPNRAYSIVDRGTRGKDKYGSDGKIAWDISLLSGTRVLEGEQLANRLLDYMFDGPDAWKSFFESVETEGIEDVNERPCYKVVFTPNQGSPRINYYDKKSFLLVKQINEAKDQGGTYKIETFLEDYKKAGEILSAHKFTDYAMGQVIYVSVVKSIETNIEMPEGIFELPEQIQKILQSKDEGPKVYEPLPPISAVAKTQEHSTFEVDLSPAKWDPADVEEYDQSKQTFGRNNTLKNPLYEGENGVIVGTICPPAQRAGLEALRQGGTAMDAALTTALTTIASIAGDVVSYAEAMVLIYYDAATDHYYSLNAGWNSLLEENDPMSIPGLTSWPNNLGYTEPSGRTVLVPGFMAGVEAGHKRFGKLPFSALFTPAIYYAEKGLKIPPPLAHLIFSRQSVLSRLPETKRVFTNKETGNFYKAGEQFYQPELAVTLRAVANQGATYMYTGEWAKRLVALVRRDGGKITMDDLKNYEVNWSEPLKIPYRDYTIYALPPPDHGGVITAQVLNVAEEVGLADMGHYSESPEAFFWLFQINNLAEMANIPQCYRSYLLKGLDASIPSLATKAHAGKLWEMMSRGQFELTKTPVSKGPKHTDAVVAIDRWGNVAALCHTINGEWTGIFVDGVSIGAAASWQQQLILETGPGKRIPTGMEPLIISRNGKPFVALSSVGGLHQATNSVLMNIMDFDMGLKEAIEAPSLNHPKYGPSGNRIAPVFDGNFSDELLEGVKALGLEVEVIQPRGATGVMRGSVIGAMIDSDGKRKAVTNPFVFGVAIGY